ncbi:hypothetical protein ACSLBF_20980 (plasmid) [Pseudoalteromonas sp. T1lg65]|uniref:hypothetical protein n=1 Tax=Pseudoalteromonas sp. T1lg65 TaxID=2077101 RepID=UPI003F799768
MNKREALAEFITFGANQEQAIAIIVASDEPCHLRLTQSMLKGALARYVDGRISEDELQMWAYVVDSRDEIEKREFEDYIYALINPELMGGLSKTNIKKMLALLDD